MRLTIWILAIVLLACGTLLTVIGLNEGCDFFTIIGLSGVFCFIITVSLEFKGILKNN